MDNPSIMRLVGQELDMVSFVRDYVQLRIDYSVVTALAVVRGSIGGASWRLGDDCSADWLRKYISRTVTAVEVIEDERIVLMFGADRIELSLRQEDRTGPEAVHFVLAGEDGRPSGVWSVW